MPSDDWRHKLETLQQQVETVRAAVTHPAQWPGILQQTVEILQAALEEPRVADEERQQQHKAVVVAEQAAEAMHQRYQILFDCAPDGYLVTDSQGLIQEANRAAVALLGIPED